MWTGLYSGYSGIMVYRNDLGAIYIKGLILLIKLWACAVQQLFE